MGKAGEPPVTPFTSPRALHYPAPLDGVVSTDGTAPIDVPLSAYPVRRSTTATYLVGPELVVAARDRGEVIALNLTASALWELCDGALDIGAIADRLGATFGQGRDEVLAAVRSSLADFHDRGLVDLYAGGLPTPGVGADPAAETGWFAVTFFRHTVNIYTDDAQVAKNVRRIFGGMLRPVPGAAVGQLVVVGAGGAYRALQDGAEQPPPATLRDAVTWLKHQTVRHLQRARPDLLWLHAGAAAKGERVLLCLGQGGSGKSTLIMALIADGWSYISDDVVPYDPVTGGALPFPLAPFNRVWGHQMVDDIRQLDKVRHRVPTAQVTAASRRIAALAFPTFSVDGPTGVQQMSPAVAAVALSAQAMNVAAFRGDALHACADLAGRIPAFGVAHGPDTQPDRLLRPWLGW